MTFDGRGYILAASHTVPPETLDFETRSPLGSRYAKAVSSVAKTL